MEMVCAKSRQMHQVATCMCTYFISHSFQHKLLCCLPICVNFSLMHDMRTQWKGHNPHPLMTYCTTEHSSYIAFPTLSFTQYSMVMKYSLLRYYNLTDILLKSIRVHLSPGSTCDLVAYTLRILGQRYTFFMGHTAVF